MPGFSPAYESFRYNKFRIAFRRSAFTPASLVSIPPTLARLAASAAASGALHSGHRFANPGLSGRSSNSSSQTTQTFHGNAILHHSKTPPRVANVTARAGSSRVPAKFVAAFVRTCENRRMLVHLFRGPGRVFGVTGDPTGANLPPKFAPWTAFKSIEICPGESTPGVNADECLDDIEKFGFHLTEAHMRITDSAL